VALGLEGRIFSNMVGFSVLGYYANNLVWVNLNRFKTKKWQCSPKATPPYVFRFFETGYRRFAITF
jgi:hypothetical protein